MRHASMFVSTLPLALAACVDVQSPTTPRSAAPNQPLSAAAFASPGDPSTIIYSNFGPRLTFDSLAAHAWVVQFPGPDVTGRVVSQQFTPTRDATFGAARVALSHLSGPGSVAVLLHADNQGLPGNVIDMIWIEALNPGPAVYVATSNRFPTLTGGAHYWLTVVPAEADVVEGWNWNATGDLSSTTFALFEGESWSIVPNQTRGAFQIEAPRHQVQGPFLHEVSGGGTMPFDLDGTVEKLTYAVTARQNADGSAKGEMLFRAHDLRIQLKGTVTCLAVVDNRAYLSGDITQINLPTDAQHFVLALEDNGEGSHATRPDRVSLPMLFSDFEQSVGAGAVAFARRLPCILGPGLFLDWANGNVQVR